MSEKGEGFKKDERLCSLKLIEELFKNGRVLFLHPFRIIWKPLELKTGFPSQVAITVPKRNFKKAVHRNLLKRRIRESFRKQKYLLYTPLEEKGVNIVFMIQFTGKEISDYSSIETAMVAALKKLSSAVCAEKQS